MPIEVGHEAPDFEIKNQFGELVRLSDLRGKKNVVLVFYPYAFTPTCTTELCTIRDRLTTFDNDETVTLAVSIDHKYTLRAFADQEGYTFRLLADFWPHGAVATEYGVSVSGLIEAMGTDLQKPEDQRVLGPQLDGLVKRARRIDADRRRRTGRANAAILDQVRVHLEPRGLSGIRR